MAESETTWPAAHSESGGKTSTANSVPILPTGGLRGLHFAELPFGGSGEEEE